MRCCGGGDRGLIAGRVRVCVFVVFVAEQLKQQLQTIGACRASTEHSYTV